MAIGLHSRAFHADSTDAADSTSDTPSAPESPGLKLRRAQYNDAFQDYEVQRTLGPGAQGAVQARRNLEQAKRALVRQERVAAGKPAV